MQRARRPRGLRRFGIAAAVAGGILLASCSNTQDGRALARQACVHVHLSVRDWARARVAGTPATTVAVLEKRAAQELRTALPLAALANSDDGSWNSLMTTISEGATVDEAHLVPALDAQCVLADTNSNVNPQNGNGNVGGGTGGGAGRPTTTFDTQNVNPKPASPAGGSG